jgi:tRNA dimethylallyltransferase
VIKGHQVPFHLIDILEPGYKYNVYEYQQDFLKAYNKIIQKNKTPVLCGGSGMYIEAVIKGYKLIKVPKNETLRAQLEERSLQELAHILSQYQKLHNKTDTDTRKRTIRAIEIADYYSKHPKANSNYPDLNYLLIGIHFDRRIRRERITERLKQRLNTGMIDEVKALMDKGLTPDQLIYYGLEYKYITLYLTGDLSYEAMVEKLNIAIHQFAKRQMTWFRRMERNGMKINWIDGHWDIKRKTEAIKTMIKQA